MKLSNRSIEKSYFSLLDSQIFLNEKIILDKIKLLKHIEIIKIGLLSRNKIKN
jgi:hypothetical protein